MAAASSPDHVGRIRWGAFDAALYAASLGLGERDLRFVDATQRNFRALPTLPLGLTFRAEKAGRPWEHPLLLQLVDFDPLKLLHGEQRIQWPTPTKTTSALGGIFPTAVPTAFDGSLVTSLTCIVDRSPDFCVVYFKNELVRSGESAEVARSFASMFLRGGKLRPGAVAPAGVTIVKKYVGVPLTLSDATQKKLTALLRGGPTFTLEISTFDNQAAVYRLNGDDNPIHIDPSAAASVGFKRPILHGLCTFGMVATAVMKHLEGVPQFEGCTVQSFGARFSGVVTPGEAITVHAAVLPRESSDVAGTIGIVAMVGRRPVLSHAFVELSRAVTKASAL